MYKVYFRSKQGTGEASNQFSRVNRTHTSRPGVGNLRPGGPYTAPRKVLVSKNPTKLTSAERKIVLLKDWLQGNW